MVDVRRLLEPCAGEMTCADPARRAYIYVIFPDIKVGSLDMFRSRVRGRLRQPVTPHTNFVISGGGVGYPRSVQQSDVVWTGRTPLVCGQVWVLVECS